MGEEFFEYYDENSQEMKSAGPLRWPVRANLVKYKYYVDKIWEDYEGKAEEQE